MLATRYILDEDHLKYYDERLKSWASAQPVKTLPSSLYPWAQTAKAGAVSCWPVGGTQLLPTVDFLFTEVPPASGDKSPTNPSTITGVSSINVTRANSNLIRWPYYDPSVRKSNGITWTVNADGSISASGTSTASSVFRLQLTDNYPTQAMLIPRGTYHFSGCPSGGGGNTYRFDVAIYTPHLGTRATKTPDHGRGGTLVVTEPALCSFYCLVNSGQTLSDLQFKPKLQLDVVDEPFEKNEQAVYTFPLNGTYYGGEIDLATGLMTVTHYCTTVNTFYQFTEAKTDCILVRFRCDYYSGESSDLVSYVCDLFPSSRDTSDFEHVRQNNYSAVSATLYLAKSRLDLSGATNPSAPTDAEWLAAANAWVAEHPFKFVSMLKDPYTVQLDPLALSALAQTDKYTPRLNTIYTDASSVQVGYVKSPIREEFELQQAIVSQGGNI